MAAQGGGGGGGMSNKGGGGGHFFSPTPTGRCDVCHLAKVSALALYVPLEWLRKMGGSAPQYILLDICGPGGSQGLVLGPHY